MSDFIRGSAKTIGDLLSSDFVFRIPSFQRPYAWPREHALQLLDDVVAALRRGAGLGPRRGDYYLGNVILARPDGSPTAGVVDGQQRLITLTILLSLLRDRGGAMAHEAARAVRDEQGRWRVVPREQDADFLLEFVQLPGSTTRVPADPPPAAEADHGDPADAPAPDEPAPAAISEEAAAAEEELDPDEDELEEAVEDDEEDEPDGPPPLAPVHDSRRAMLDNRDALRRRLDEVLADAGDQPGAPRVTAEALTYFILYRCHVIEVQVPDNADAHRVFVVMHTRGVDLTDTDVLKSEVLGAIGDEAEARICQRIWEDAEARLGRDEFELLFRHLRTIRLKSAARKAAFAELREAYEPERAPAAFVQQVVEPAARRLEAILEGTWRCRSGSEAEVTEINRRLVRLGLLPHGSWAAVAMRLLERFGDDATALVALVRRLDALAYGLFLLEPTDERIRRLGDVLQGIDAGRTASQLCAGELALAAPEARQLAYMITGGTFRGTTQKRIVLLRRLDAEQLPGVGPLPDYDGTNVEHVLPVSPKPGSRWQQKFPQPAGLVQNLGNLIVIPSEDNHRLGNEEFPVKKEGKEGRYAKRGYRQIHASLGLGLIPEILEVEDWTPAIVEERRQRFENLLLQLWQLERPTSRIRATAAREQRQRAAQAARKPQKKKKKKNRKKR